MRKYLKNLAVGSLLLLGATACSDLDVINPNAPDAGRSLVTGGDVVSLIGGSFNSWFSGSYNYSGAGMAISNTAFQHAAPWANSGMEKYGRLPRIAFINSIADGEYSNMTRNWFYSYRALAAVADGLRALEDSDVQADLEQNEILSAQAFGKFMQGLAHAGLAASFSEGFIIDDNTTLLESGAPDPGAPVSYTDLMTAALAYFDECISLSANASWDVPDGWMGAGAGISGPELAKVASSMKARYRASNARTWTERVAVDWDAVIVDVDAGITADYVAEYDRYNGWDMGVLRYGTNAGWGQLGLFVHGMADQDGHFQEWNALSVAAKHHSRDSGAGDPFLIITPDLRFAQGADVAEQRADTRGPESRYFRIVKSGSEEGGTWKRPDRGQWRWSWYKHHRGEDYLQEDEFDIEEIRMEEMNLLKAEALYHNGDPGGAATIINVTRAVAGLSATDALGTNTSCVPKLIAADQGFDSAPNDAQCGGLFEMLKWEKRMENTFRGPLGNLWYFDGRGWGDLWKDTFLQLPMPCGEADVLGLLPCYTWGGPGGEMAAPTSNYRWNGEG